MPSLTEMILKQLGFDDVISHITNKQKQEL